MESKGTDQLNLANKSGDTPLMIAVKEQQEEVVQFLVEQPISLSLAATARFPPG